MAEFTEVVRQKLRMCNDFDGCKGCQLCDRGCDIVHVVGLEDEEAAKRANFLEQIVMAWAAEHPEQPVYPTLIEYLRGLGLERHRMCDPIPADVARKLGLKPKEVEK